MAKRKLTVKILFFLVLSDILEAFHQFCFKKSTFLEGDPDIKGFYDILLFLKGPFSSPFLWIGLLSVIVAFVIWSAVLSKIDLSVAVPMASFSYIFVALTSIIFLHETVTLLRWSGIFLILIGVIFVSMSSQEKESAFR
ncbi:MAG: EamA family transporter [Thermodesulfobacteriota bacterium]